MRTLFASIITVGLVVLFSSWSVNEAAASSDGKAKTAQASAMGKRGFFLPYIDPSRGRKLFASKGCVVCHSINGIGGEDATSLVPEEMPSVMNPFEFAAKMWRGAGAMISMQEDELGGQIEFTGSELADIIAFVHTPDEQKKFSEDDIPPRIKKLMEHSEDEDEEHEKKKDDKQ